VGALRYNSSFLEQLIAHDIPLIWQLKADIAAYPIEAVRRFIAHCRVLFCNRLEADYLCQTLHVGDLRRLINPQLEVVVLTMGAVGSQVITKRGTVAVPSTTGVTVVDSTGAGDAYTAGFLKGYLAGAEPHTCGRMGAVLSSFVLEQVGCQTNLPTWDVFQQRYQAHFGKL
jgi:adenosine kinase